MKQILELSDLIGDESKTREVFNCSRVSSEQFNENIQQMLRQARIGEDLTGRIGELSPLMDVLPKGIVVCPETARDCFNIPIYGSEKIHQVHCDCRRDFTIPMKREDEVYLIFPYTYYLNTDTDRMELAADIKVVKNFLIGELDEV